MRLILLAGGSGKRLWPLSNELRTKPFIKLLDSTHGSSESISMIQRIWYQLQKANLSDLVTISTNASQIDMIKDQLDSNIPLIIEPSTRDTYPAILLACSYLYSIENIDPNEGIIILPVDTYAEDDFFQHLYDLDSIVQDSNVNLALIGITPSFPSEKYGYLVPGTFDRRENLKFQNIKYFSEKPNSAKAKHLLNNGAMWNSGVFAFQLNFILEHLQSLELPSNFDLMREKYKYLPKNSFDYELVEKTKNTVFIPYKGNWKDVGTWNTLTEEINTPIIGNGSISIDSKNVHIINELDIPVSVLGLSNIIVAISPSGVLVSDKEASMQIKDVVNFSNQRPMYKEFSWGCYRVIDHIKYSNNKEVLTKRVSLSAHKNLGYQKHSHRHKTLTITNGTGLFIINNKIKKVKSGDTLDIPLKTFYSIKALSNLEFIEVQIGSKLIEDDSIQTSMSWEEITSNCSSITIN